MAEKMSEQELVGLQELLMAQMIQLDAITQLLIEKGFITEQEFVAKLKQVQNDYESRRSKRL
jgi:hypothetical protein